MSRSHCNKVCKKCPFKKNTEKSSYTTVEVEKMNQMSSMGCKMNSHKECAGHMLMNWNRNIYVNISRRLKEDLTIQGREEIFSSYEMMLNHYKKTKIASKSVATSSANTSPVETKNVKNRSEKSISGLHKMLYGLT